MTNEIKEILLYLKKKENTRRIKCITLEETTALLDYITTLQKENEILNNIIKELREYVRNNEWAKDYEISSCRTHLLEILDKENKQ